MPHVLKKALLAEYGSFADKRIKKLETGHVFVVDDRGRPDAAADGSLYGWFCMIFADVVSENDVEVTLHNMPIDDAVRAWAQTHRAKLDVRGTSPRLSVVVTSGTAGSLDELALAIEAIVTPGRAYSTAAFKYVCPRTATSLRRLGATLKRQAGAA